MTKREDRSIRANLEKHAWLMAKLMSEGMSREDASKHAFKQISKDIGSALAKVSK